MVFKRLYALQMKLTNTLEHRAGLNPKAYRKATQIGRRGADPTIKFVEGKTYTIQPRPAMLDGALLARYVKAVPRPVCQHRVSIGSA